MLVVVLSEFSMPLRIQSVILPAVVAALALSVHAACQAQANSESSAQLARWGVETLDAIKRDLWIADRGLYAEKAATGGGRKDTTNPPLAPPYKGGEVLVPALMWGAGVQLSALAAAARIDPDSYVTPLAAYAVRQHVEPIAAGPVGTCAAGAGVGRSLR
jgi:hypothetical protein